MDSNLNIESPQNLEIGYRPNRARPGNIIIFTMFFFFFFNNL